MGTRLLPPIVQALDTWAASQTPPMSRSEAIRHMLVDFLRRHGLLA